MVLLPLAISLALLQEDPEPYVELPTRIELVEFTGIEVDTFDDFFGRAVLIEFFADWCAPCARQIPKLNQLQRTYEGAGLVVLGVTSDDKAAAAAWAAEHAMAFPYAFDPNLRLQVELGFNPLPFGLLLDPTGAVAWSGHPSGLEQATIEAAVEGALDTPMWNWPDEAVGVAEALRGHRQAAVRAALARVEDPRLKEQVEELVERRLSNQKRVAERALERGDFLTAHDLWAHLKPAFQGMAEEADFIQGLERALEKDEARTVLETQQYLREVWRTIHDVATRAAAEELLEEIRALSRDQVGTYVEVQAARYERALQNLIPTLH